ncbi:hypothetical protein L211DRAFT_665236 [Terfezia boudieri ATCC MYA-4762]|uniref:Uncharacterized protein n=1 Tax=Terfezia boudieri ATCC MYA-4762 TaxID=1051890 RepID=A0A3N4LMB3_9PEZI|nr:hypothetical protein L211DRAFT_665236 [Terfezia boudieri ATCC MYA-4762]
MSVKISISRVSTSQYKSIMNYLGLLRVSVEFEVPPVNRTFEEFNWGPEKEDAQMDKCLAWLRTHFTLPENMQFHPVANNTSFLNYTVGEGTSKYFLKGTTDFIVLPTRYIRDFNSHGGMQLAIELNKEIKEADCRQADQPDFEQLQQGLTLATTQLAKLRNMPVFNMAARLDTRQQNMEARSYILSNVTD